MTFQQQVRERRPPNGNSDSTTTCYQWKSQKKNTLWTNKTSICKDKNKRKMANACIKHSIHILHQQWKSLSRSPGALVMHTLENGNTLHLTAQKNHLFSAAAFWQSWNVTIRQKILHLKYILQHISNIVKFTASPQCTLWKHLLEFGNSKANQRTWILRNSPLLQHYGNGGVLLFCTFLSDVIYSQIELDEKKQISLFLLLGRLMCCWKRESEKLLTYVNKSCQTKLWIHSDCMDECIM